MIFAASTARAAGSISPLNESGDMRDLDSLFAALAGSRFRARFRLDAKDRAYLERKGLPLVLDHAADFVAAGAVETSQR
jgi:hypothetical protein